MNNSDVPSQIDSDAKRPYIGEVVVFEDEGSSRPGTVIDADTIMEPGGLIRIKRHDTGEKEWLHSDHYDVEDVPDAMARHRAETRRHIWEVRARMMAVHDAIVERSATHDQSKLQAPEAPQFAEISAELRDVEYGSGAYEAALDDLDEALAHHYAENDHHPEHFSEGIEGMHLIQLLEMLCDWSAATLRHEDGDLLESIEQNQERFGYSDDVKQILRNTAHWLHHHDAFDPESEPTELP